MDNPILNFRGNGCFVILMFHVGEKSRARGMYEV